MSSAIRNPKEVIERLCALVSEVGERQFASAVPHDCFCGKNPRGIVDFQVDEGVIVFIESAVRDRLSNKACSGLLLREPLEDSPWQTGERRGAGISSSRNSR
jgi:hypothetical protein